MNNERTHRLDTHFLYTAFADRDQEEGFYSQETSRQKGHQAQDGQKSHRVETEEGCHDQEGQGACQEEGCRTQEVSSSMNGLCGVCLYFAVIMYALEMSERLLASQMVQSGTLAASVSGHCINFLGLSLCNLSRNNNQL